MPTRHTHNNPHTRTPTAGAACLRPFVLPPDLHRQHARSNVAPTIDPTRRYNGLVSSSMWRTNRAALTLRAHKYARKSERCELYAEGCHRRFLQAGCGGRVKVEAGEGVSRSCNASMAARFRKPRHEAGCPGTFSQSVEFDTTVWPICL